ncbi:MAG: VCBS repeat-containing protein [Flavobacteriales bacterium]|nr:VCBS repeat-containing protein [Flavobacteriales bacterium]
MFSYDQLDESLKAEVNTLSSSIFINKGNGKFDFHELPQKAQFSPLYALYLKDFDKDGDLDIIAGGNLYNTKPEIGRYDASFGLFLENDGKGKFEVPDNGYGFKLKGEVRSIIFSNSNIVVGRNSDSIAIFKYLNE